MIKIKHRDCNEGQTKVKLGTWYSFDDDTILDFSDFEHKGYVISFEAPLVDLLTQYDNFIRPDKLWSRPDVVRIGFYPTVFASIEDAVGGILYSISDYRRVWFQGIVLNEKNTSVVNGLFMVIERGDGTFVSIALMPSGGSFCSVDRMIDDRFIHNQPKIEPGKKYDVNSMEVWYYASRPCFRHAKFHVDVKDCPISNPMISPTEERISLVELFENLFKQTGAKSVEFSRTIMKWNELNVVCHDDKFCFRFIISGDVDFHWFWN